MHEHNNNGNKESRHKGMWLMMIPCLLLVAVILFSGSALSSSRYLWLIIIGACVIPHIWMMFKGHGGHGDTDMEDKTNGASAKQPETNLSATTSVTRAGDENNKHKSDGCCH